MSTPTRCDEARERRVTRPDHLFARLRAEALRQGFDVFGAVRVADAPDQTARLAAWLAAGAHGDMAWMAETAARRAHPAALWPQARTVLMVGLNYGPDEDPRAAVAARETGAVSVYARHRDYHDLLKGRLKHFAAQLPKIAGAGAVKVFVDTAPLMEKPLAQAAGLGWQGKHTNLVSRAFGAWLFLGAVLTDLEIVGEGASADHCGACRACLDACPTQAFPQPYVLDARRCIAYLTNEHRGVVPRSLRPAIGNRVYGCDACLAVCPWNRFAQTTREAKLAARADLTRPPLRALLALDEPAFRAFFSASPIKRVGHARFMRNVLIAAGNSGAPALAPRVAAHLDDPRPIVRGVAIWALARLAPAMLQRAARRRAAEQDRDVLEEWDAAEQEGGAPKSRAERAPASGPASGPESER